MSHMNYSEDIEPPTKKPLKWKNCCASILTQKVEQLDDAMIFHLATLPAPVFCTVRLIFDKYSKGLLKGQKLPRSKKSPAKALELKGSNFKCLRGLETSTASSLLKEVSEGSLSFSELQSQCQTVKQLYKIQAAFIKATHCETWEKACEKYPNFTTCDKLEPFKKLNFSTPTIPEEFMKFCQIAQKYVSGDEDLDTGSTKVHDDDNIFLFQHKSAIGLFYKKNVLDITTDTLNEIFMKASRLSTISVEFSGFSLALFDLTGKSVDGCDEAWGGQEAKQLALLLRALNYSVGKQQYTVAFLSSLLDISSVASSLNATSGTLKTGVCAINSTKAEGKGVLEDHAYGIVFLFEGGASPNVNTGNVFICDKDSPYIDEATKQPLYPTQKPVNFTTQLVNLFTNEGDWIIDGVGGIGTSMIAALRGKRNCISLEDNPLLFINSKINVIGSMQDKKQEEPEKEQDDNA